MFDLFRDPQGFLLTTLYCLPGLIIGFGLHEFAHAWMSDRLGDPTPRAQGRLTVNPLAHLDPIGTIMLLLFHFGYGKPVQINPSYYKHPKRDLILVSLSGITMNLIVAIFAAIAYALLLNFGVMNITMINIVRDIMVINVSLMVFNLFPCPPLDGYQLIKQIFLGGKTINFFWKIEQYGYILLLILVFSDLINYWMSFLGGYVYELLNLIIGLF